MKERKKEKKELHPQIMKERKKENIELHPQHKLCPNHVNSLFLEHKQ
jgi:hypothetical protein